jgi:2-dehydro-3-deoxyphosphooctonate aldolase (KDO 8-P synthase)
MKEKVVVVKKPFIKIANSLPIILIAGPCVIENESKAFAIAKQLKEISENCGISLVFKASYDKANRSSAGSFRGPGLKAGLLILSNIKEKLNVPVLTDVHCREDVREAAKVVDILQVPAFLCRQTDLITECAKTGLPVNVKKGQFLAPEDMNYIIGKIEKAGGDKILISERGASFGYHNLVVDFRSLPIMKKSGYPVIYDATHSVQLPQGGGGTSGGNPEFIEPLSKAAAAIGVAGLFVEVHPDPKKALSDGANSLKLSMLEKFIRKIMKIDNLIKST